MGSSDSLPTLLSFRFRLIDRILSSFSRVGEGLPSSLQFLSQRVAPVTPKKLSASFPYYQLIIPASSLDYRVALLILTDDEATSGFTHVTTRCFASHPKGALSDSLVILDFSALPVSCYVAVRFYHVKNFSS